MVFLDHRRQLLGQLVLVGTPRRTGRAVPPAKMAAAGAVAAAVVVVQALFPSRLPIERAAVAVAEPGGRQPVPAAAAVRAAAARLRSCFLTAPPFPSMTT